MQSVQSAHNIRTPIPLSSYL